MTHDLRPGLHWIQFRGEDSVAHFGICDVIGEAPFCDVVLIYDFEKPKQEKIVLNASLVLELFRLRLDPGAMPRRVFDFLRARGQIQSDNDDTRPPSSYSRPKG